MRGAWRATWRRLTVCSIALFSLVLAGCSVPEDQSADMLHDFKLAQVESLAAQVPSAVRQRGYLSVAVLQAAPMAYKAADGTSFVGLEIDLVRAVAELLGLDVRFQETELAGMMPGLQSGRFDIAIGSITDTKAREKEADFVVYAAYGQAISESAAQAATDPLTFTSLCGKKVAVATGSVQEQQFLPSLTQDCQAKGKAAVIGESFPDTSEQFLSVVSGRSDVAFLNEVGVIYQVAQSEGALVVADRGLGTDPKGMVMAKGSGLQQAILQSVEELQRQNVLKEIFDAWDVGSVQIQPRLNSATR